MAAADTALGESFAHLAKKPGVRGVIVLTATGTVVRSTYSDEDTIKLATAFADLLEPALAAVKALGTGDDLAFLRLSTKKGVTLLLTPELGFVMIVVHDEHAKFP